MVTLGIDVLDIREVNTAKHSMIMAISLVLSWEDSRVTCKNQVELKIPCSEVHFESLPRCQTVGVNYFQVHTFGFRSRTYKCQLKWN